MDLGSAASSDAVFLDVPRFPDRLDLTGNDIHVVRVRLDVAIGCAADLLDDDERHRASRFVFERDHRRFVIAHAWVRILLGRCLSRRPESLRFVAGPHGKPALADAAIDLRFNLSHAGERALVALALGRDVGVDIEEERQIDALELASRFFAPAESEALRALAPSERIPAFFRCWTRKEAFIKALGEGLSFPLREFEVSVADDHSSQLLRSCATPDMLRCWRIARLASEPGQAAALAATAGDWRVVQWETPLQSL
jgi:4'-phosphopantetheinyl transferase